VPVDYVLWALSFFFFRRSFCHDHVEKQCSSRENSDIIGRMSETQPNILKIVVMYKNRRPKFGGKIEENKKYDAKLSCVETANTVFAVLDPICCIK